MVAVMANPLARRVWAGRPALIDPFLRRLHDRHFWVVQGLVLLITLLHHAFEVWQPVGRHGSLAFVPVSLYLIPALYAGLSFGVAGALPTALFSAALALPNAFIWHESDARLGEVIQLTVMVVMAVIVARRVDRETLAKERAEQMGHRLAQLNATASAASRSLEPCRVVRDTLEAILRQGKADVVWVQLASGIPGAPHLTALAGVPPVPVSLPPPWEAATRRVSAGATSHLERLPGRSGDGDDLEEATSLVIVPIRAAGTITGALGVACRPPACSADDLNLLGAIALQLAVALDNTRHYQEERRALAELRDAQAKLEAYVRLAVQAQEEERKRLARELHDETIQSLLVIKTRLDGLAMGRRPAPAVRARLDELTRMLQTAVDDVRRFSRDLRPSLLDDLGLVQAVDWLVADLTRRTGIEARLVVDGEPRRLRDDVEVALYRILQEALHNIERHAAAGSATVTLVFEPGCIRAGVHDDGRGFDPEHPADDSRGVTLGLLGMRERAKLVDGSLTIESRPGGGTTVIVTLSDSRDRSPNRCSTVGGRSPVASA